MVEKDISIDKPLNGTLSEGRDKGEEILCFGPELRMWVAATLYATAVDVYGRILGTINDDEENDIIYFEYSILACALQVPPEMWPPSCAAFWAYWDAKIATIEVTQPAKDVGSELLYLRKAPFYGRVLMSALRVLTGGLAPQRIRKEYGVNRHPMMYKLKQLAVKVFYYHLPLRLRRLPVDIW
ncbi:hypothetical protein F5Y16DRAFT_306392 [Xylariaceae sp. FL0255]|nr:hypothetical protein F5Y16DRAFT_306392 [Xylariaceae sp. FL0255]